MRPGRLPDDAFGRESLGREGVRTDTLVLIRPELADLNERGQDGCPLPLGRREQLAQRPQSVYCLIY